MMNIDEYRRLSDGAIVRMRYPFPFPFRVYDGANGGFVHAYGRPNGGHRTLPGYYTALDRRWLRSTGVYTNPMEMSTGHIQNCLNLLKESHVNIIGKINLTLGKMASHLRNRPDLVQQLESLAKQVEAVDVEEMYPVWTALSEELMCRREIYHWPDPEEDLYGF